NLCFIGRTRLLREAGGSPERMIEHACNRNSALGDRLSSLVPSDDDFLGTARVTFDRRGPRSRAMLEVGDAAGMIAPLCGDGMSMAMRSAELAERALS